MVMLHVATDLVVRHLGNLGKGPVYPQTMLAKSRWWHRKYERELLARNGVVAAWRTEISGRLLGLRSAGSGLGDNEIRVRLAVGLELHLVLVGGESDAGIDRSQCLVGRLLLADVVVSGGRRLKGLGWCRAETSLPQFAESQSMRWKSCAWEIAEIEAGG